MEDEMSALHCNETWDLIPLPYDRKTVGCHWFILLNINQMVPLLLVALEQLGDSIEEII
jgi:hypothetical protein